MQNLNKPMNQIEIECIISENTWSKYMISGYSTTFPKKPMGWYYRARASMRRSIWSGNNYKFLKLNTKPLL